MFKKTAFALAALSLIGCGEGDFYEEPSEVIEETTSSIINGSTDFTYNLNEQLKTVQLRRNGSLKCTATILRPTVVLTATHCLTTNSSPSGTLFSPSVFTVNGVKATEIVRAAGNLTDASLLFFASQVVDTSTQWETFTAIDPSAVNWYAGRRVVFTGYGKDENNANAGTRRIGWQTVGGANTPYGASDTGWNGNGLYTDDPVAGTAANEGDSGGALWGSRFYPPAVLGVASVGDCVAGGATYWAQATSFRGHFRQMIANRVNDGMSLGFDLASDEFAFQELQNSTGTAANWVIQDSAFVQTANAGEAFQIQRGNFENVVVSAWVQSSDDDTIGLLARYVDRNNHYRCEANRAYHFIRVVKRRNGTDTVLKTTTWNGTFASDIYLEARADEKDITCTIDTVQATASDMTFPVGKVGLYDHFNKGAKYKSYGTFQLSPRVGSW
jgi:hypothetical protein